MNTTSQEYFNSLLVYDPDTGYLYWKIKPCKRIAAGSRAGTPNAQGNIVIGLNGQQYLAQRLIWCMRKGSFPKSEIYYINQDKSDNREENLSLQPQGTLIDSTISAANKSGYTGVSWNKSAQKWTAKICADGKSIHLGYFEEKDDAIETRRQASLKMPIE
jgi:uncharacterized protein YuzE